MCAHFCSKIVVGSAANARSAVGARTAQFGARFLQVLLHITLRYSHEELFQANHRSPLVQGVCQTHYGTEHA